MALSFNLTSLLKTTLSNTSHTSSSFNRFESILLQIVNSTCLYLAPHNFHSIPNRQLHLNFTSFILIAPHIYYPLCSHPTLTFIACNNIIVNYRQYNSAYTNSTFTIAPHHFHFYDLYTYIANTLSQILSYCNCYLCPSHTNSIFIFSSQNRHKLYRYCIILIPLTPRIYKIDRFSIFCHLFILVIFSI